MRLYIMCLNLQLRITFERGFELNKIMYDLKVLLIILLHVDTQIKT